MGQRDGTKTFYLLFPIRFPLEFCADHFSVYFFFTNLQPNSAICQWSVIFFVYNYGYYLVALNILPSNNAVNSAKMYSALSLNNFIFMSVTNTKFV